MTVFDWFWIIFGVCILIGFGLFLFFNLKKNFEHNLTQIQKEKDWLEKLYRDAVTKNRELCENIENMSVARKFAEKQANLAAEEKDTLEAELKLLQENYTALQISSQVGAVKEDSIEDLEAQLVNLRRIIDDKVGELNNLNSSAAEITELMNQKLRGLEELDASMKVLEGRICDGKKVLETIEGAIVTTNSQLRELNELKSAVLAVEEGSGNKWTITPGEDKKRLIELIHQLVNEYGNAYPILRKELLKVEWSAVWLPQLQQLCVREGLDRSGIYKITWKENDRVVYIGQAVSIKERWYTHFKKMLGVEAKGTERLYDYRPDDMTWEVVEFKEGNLDSDEKYWIDYFKCREIGLNKKR